ncbi:hypothetical protein CF64_03190 [Bradyrhizobium japonicum]|nr:hypothetical protein CF64_03190 [Bradyrhizobium japonicum]
MKFRNSEIDRGIVGLSFGVASISGSIAAFYSELFDSRIRYTGLVFAKEVSGVVVGGFTPLIPTLLVQWSGGPSWPVSVYMMVTGVRQVMDDTGDHAR